MSDNIDIPVTADDDGVNRLVSAFDRLEASITRLGENTALGQITAQMKEMQGSLTTAISAMSQQMAEMQAVLTTRFADLAATSEKMLAGMGTTQARQIEANGDAAVKATEAAALKVQTANARFWEQTARGASTNVTSAFYQLSQNIPVEEVTARYGQMAANIAQSLDGQLEKLRQYQANAKSLYETFYKPQAGATEAEIAQANAMNAARDAALRARSASPIDVRTLLGLPSEAEARAAGAVIAAQFREGVAAEKAAASVDPRTLLGLPSSTEMKGFSTQLAIQMRTAVEEAAIQAKAGLQSHAAPSIDPRTLLGLPSEAEMKGFSTQLAINMRTAVEAERTELATLRAVSAEAAAAQIDLSSALRQAEGAFRGAAHQAGIYGLHHGQLIALLAGGAVAAALHHIAETGAEVEFQLKSLNALSGDMRPVDMDKFIGLSAGTMTDLKDAAEGVHALAQAGLSQQEAFRALPDVMRLAQLGEMHVAQAAEMAVESMHAFGLTSADIGRVGDTLVAVGSQANVSVHKLAEDMKSAAVTGQLFNLSMEEITATVGALAERGLTIQPLSSALNKLYEPSAKTAKAMQEMGLSAKDAAGQFKPYTQFMEELAAKVNEFKEPGDPLKMLGMSTQSIKAMEVMTQHFENYDHLLHTAKDSANKMFEATAAKADTTEGAWKQLGSTFQGVLVKAFEEAEPTIRQIESDLLGIVSSSDVQGFFSGLATGVANVTRALIENRGTIEMAVAGYAALRVAPAILESISAATVFLFGRTAAATAAIVAEGAAATAATGQLELFAVSETAAAAGAAEVTATATTAEIALAGLATAARTAVAVLGPVGLALAAVSVGFELFGRSSTAAEQEHTRMNNSIDSTITSMQQELKHLEDLQEQLIKTGKIGAESAYQVQLAFAQTEEATAKANLEAAKSASKGPRKLEAGDDGTLTQFESNESSADLVNAQKAYDLARKRAETLENLHAGIAAKREDVQIGHDIDTLLEKIKRLPHELEGLEAVDPKKAAGLHAQVDELTKLDVTTANYTETLQREKEIEAAINAGKRSAPAPGSGEDKSGLRAEVELLQEKLRLKQLDAKSQIEDARSENRRGELGSLELINRELAINKSLHSDALDIAKQELNLAQQQGKKIDIARADGRVKSARKQLDLDDTAASRAIEDMFDKMDTAELTARAKTLESRGQLEDAFNLQWQAKNAATLANLSADIAATENEDYRKRLVRYQQFLEDQRRAGANDARFRQRVNGFDNINADLTTQLGSLRSQAGPGTGLSSIIGNTFAGQALYAKYIPQLQAAQAAVAATSSAALSADGVIDQNKLKKANEELRAIQDRMVEMRNGFVALGETIGTALTNAFGKGGTAMGGMINAAIAYDTKVKEIQATVAASGNTDAARAAAADATAAAQIKSYGDMAGAAKGFFNENSRGYRALQAAQTAYNAIELAMALQTAAVKIGLVSAQTSTAIAGQQAVTATAVASVGPEVAASMAKGQAAAVAGVANQAGGDPYSAFVRMAVMAGLMAALGFAVSGGGASANIAQQRQDAQGTGTVLGSQSAKSDSIARSIALTAENSSTQIDYLSAMAASLQAIQTNITSFASAVVRTTDITSPDVGDLKKGYGSTTMGSLDLTLTGGELGMYFGPLGAAIGATIGLLASKIPVIQKLATAIMGGKQSVDDSGFTMDASSLGSIAANGLTARSYADITTSGGWFRSDKHDTKMTALDADASRQFAQVLLSMGDAIKQAGSLIGVSGDDFTKRLDSFVVDIGKVSLKGLSSDDIQKQLEAVFSKVGDQMAQAAIPNLQQFQKIGEGYLETLSRVATDYAKVDASLQSISMVFGAVGIASIGAREDLIQLAGGIDKFQSSTADFATNFLTKAQQQAPVLAYVNQQMAGLNLGWVQTREQFAGVVQGLDLTSASGRQTYASLMGLESAFAATHAAIVDTTKTMQEVADERKDLQDQYDQATMTSEQLRQKDRNSLDESNRALFDQVQALKTQSSMLDLQGQVYAALGDKVGAAAVLQQQHAAALLQTDPALRAATQQLWDLQAAATKLSDVKANATSLLGDVDKAYSTLQAVVGREKDLLQKRIDSETDAVSKLSDISKSAQSALDQLSEVTPEDAAAARRAAQSSIRDSLGIVQGGGALTDDQIDSLKTALSTVTKDSTGQYATYQDYLRDQYETKNDISKLGDTTKGQLSIQQQQLDADKAQLDSWDKMLASAKDQIDTLKGISTTALSIDTALANLAVAIGTAKQNPVVASADPLTSAYQTYLNRAPDQQGLQWWQNAVASGSTTTQGAVEGIKNSTEATLDNLYKTVLGRAPDAGGLKFWMDAYGGTMDAKEIADWTKSAQKELSMDTTQRSALLKAAGVPGYATGGDFGGGLRMVGENGPELEMTGASHIYSNSQTMAMLAQLYAPQQQSNSDAATKEIKELKAQMATLSTNNSAENVALVKQLQSIVDVLQRVVFGSQYVRVKTVTDENTP